MTTVRLALFRCDKLLPAIQAKNGDYPEVFDALFRKALPPHAEVTLEMDPFDVRDNMEYPDDLDRYEAIVYTGSGQGFILP